MKRLFTLAVFAAALPLLAAELPVRQVVVFKNGVGLVVRSGEVTFDSGRATVGRLPAATYGGLRVAADGGLRIDEVVATLETVTRAGEATSIADLLDANDGRNVTLQLADRTVSGLLRSKPGISFASIESGGKTTAVHKAEVRAITTDGTLATKTTLSTPESRLEVRADASGKKRLTVSSLERSIGWTPEYTVRIGGDGRANVSLQATLLNDGADLENAEAWLAVGYPSFTFSGIRGPLDPSQSLAQFLQSLTSARWQGDVNPLANVMTQSVHYSSFGAGDEAALPDSLTEGERQQDLYMYRLKQVTLASRARGAYPLLGVTVPFRHTWDWTIEDRSRISVYGYEESRRGGDETLDQVWHSVCLENRTEVPWTTGPALVLEADKPIAQNTLFYTPAGSDTRLRLTVATDILARHLEIEKARAPEPLRKFGATYEGIDYEGTLSITNRRKEAVTVDVTRTLTGSVTAAGESGKAVRLADEPSAINPRSKLDWSVPVAPGETKTVTYVYRVWVRR